MNYSLPTIAATAASRRDGANYSLSKSAPRFLIRHLGNMGDMVFFIPPALAALKRTYPGCHITFVTAWGYKTRNWKLRNWKLEKAEAWGKRNQGGFELHLMMTNPDIDQLIHWHDTKLSLEANICVEDGKHFPTWNREYYEEQKQSGAFDKVYELDFGLRAAENPVERIFSALGLDTENDPMYQLHLNETDRAIAQHVMKAVPHPRIVLLEGLEGTTTRGWDPDKIPALTAAIAKHYGVPPIWFGGKHVPEYQGRPLTLRQNIATLAYCDAAIGVLSGPLHFAAAVGVPTLTLFADQPLHRAAPAYFLNQYIPNPKQLHRTLVGPTSQPFQFLKGPPQALTPAESAAQVFQEWPTPGRQATKSPMAAITVPEIMAVLQEIL